MIFQATLAKKDQLLDDVARFRFAMPDGPQLEFNPGQYLMIEVGDIRRRPYSIAFASADNKEFDLLVDTSPQGLGSKFLESLEVGTSVEIQGPFGINVLERGAKSYLFIATGVGIAPFMPMLKELFESGFTGPVRLVQGARSAAELLCTQELKNFQDRLPNFKWIPALSQTHDAQNSFSGRSDAWIANEYAPDADEFVYLCGAPEMVRDCRAALVQKGAPLNRLKIEVFS